MPLEAPPDFNRKWSDYVNRVKVGRTDPEEVARTYKQLVELLKLPV